MSAGGNGGIPETGPNGGAGGSGEYWRAARFPGRAATAGEGAGWVFGAVRDAFACAPAARAAGAAALAAALPGLLGGGAAGAGSFLPGTGSLALTFAVFVFVNPAAWIALFRDAFPPGSPAGGPLGTYLRAMRERGFAIVRLALAEFLLGALVLALAAGAAYLLAGDDARYVAANLDRLEAAALRFRDAAETLAADGGNAGFGEVFGAFRDELPLFAAALRAGLAAGFFLLAGSLAAFMAGFYAPCLVINARAGVLRALWEGFKAFSRNIVSLTVAGLLYAACALALHMGAYLVSGLSAAAGTAAFFAAGAAGDALVFMITFRSVRDVFWKEPPAGGDAPAGS